MGKRSSAGKPLSARKAPELQQQRRQDSDAELREPDLFGTAVLDASDASDSDDQSEADTGTDTDDSGGPAPEYFASGSDDEEDSNADTDDELDAAMLEYADAAAAAADQPDSADAAEPT